MLGMADANSIKYNAETNILEKDNGSILKICRKKQKDVLQKERIEGLVMQVYSYILALLTTVLKLILTPQYYGFI